MDNTHTTDRLGAEDAVNVGNGWKVAVNIVCGYVVVDGTGMSWYTQIMRCKYNTGVVIIKIWPHGLVRERNKWLFGHDAMRYVRGPWDE